MTPFIAELLGTMLLVLMGCGVCANVSLARSKGKNAGWMVVTTGWALGVFLGVVVAGPYSGAHLNPAVTFAMALAGQLAWTSVFPYVAAQFLGAVAGAFLVWVAYREHFNETEEPSPILGVFSTIPQIRKPILNFLTEVIGTFVLVFVVFYIAGGEIAPGGVLSDMSVPMGLGSVGAIPVTFAVWAIGLSLGGPTGYAINPARDLAPRFMHMILPIKHKGTNDWGYAWVPLFGPLAGAALAAGLYLLLG